MLTKKLSKHRAWLAERQPTTGDWQNYSTYLFAGLRGTKGISVKPFEYNTSDHASQKDGKNSTLNPNPRQNTPSVKPLMDFMIPRTGGRPGAHAREGRDTHGQAKPNHGKPRNRSRSRKGKRAPDAPSTSTTANPNHGNKRQRNKDDVPPPTERSRSRSRKSKNQNQDRRRGNQNRKQSPQKKETKQEEAPVMDKKWQLISMLIEKI